MPTRRASGSTQRSRPDTLTPSIEIEPAAGRSSPAIALKRLVLPFCKLEEPEKLRELRTINAGVPCFGLLDFMVSTRLPLSGMVYHPGTNHIQIDIIKWGPLSTAVAW